MPETAVERLRLEGYSLPATASRFGLQSIPTLLVFSGGREVDRLIGVRPKVEIARLQRLLI